jgi:hypothetical protein
VEALANLSIAWELGAAEAEAEAAGGLWWLSEAAAPSLQPDAPLSRAFDEAMQRLLLQKRKMKAINLLLLEILAFSCIFLNLLVGCSAQ